MALKPLLKRISLALLTTLAAIALLWRFQFGAQPSNEGTALSLMMPSFIQVARAEDASILSAISEEAGISAWFKAVSPIDLATVRGQFRTIEDETTDYIVGSIPVKDYLESEDVHVYIHKDGWVLAYYQKAEPASKIFDWHIYELNEGASITTKLENTIANVMVTAGSSFDQATYYDFRYPNATELMLIVESTLGDCNLVEDSFELNIPVSYTVYERSWFAAGEQEIKLHIDGNEVGASEKKKNNQGILVATQLPPNESHAVRVVPPNNCFVGFGGITLVSKEQ